jgi:predicted  nucleic acid-binding Zn-ribbon protein
MNAQLKPAAPHRPAAAAWASHLEALTRVQAEMVAPEAALSKVNAQIGEIQRAARDLETLRGQRRAARTAEHLGEKPAADVAELDRKIKALEATIHASADEQAALQDASAGLQARVTGISQRLTQERQRGPVRLNALHREAIIELLADLAEAFEPAMVVWEKILAHGDAADALRKGENSVLPPTVAGISREFGIPRLLNLGIDDLVPLLAAAQRRSSEAARAYIGEFTGE